MKNAVAGKSLGFCGLDGAERRLSQAEGKGEDEDEEISGSRMKKFLLATVSTLALTTIARAADMPAVMPAKGPIYAPVPVATWDGVYIGAQGGVVRRDTSFTEFTGVGTTLPLSDRKTGGAAGALLGFNLQHGNFVYGIEGDWSWLGTKASQTASTLSAFPFSSFDARWVATARARAGLAFNSALFYVTGGVAFGNVKNSAPFNFNFGAVSAAFIQDQTRTGWTLGGGVEYMLSPQWSVRAEFRYVDLGKESVNCRLTGNIPTACDTNAPGSYRGEFSNSLKLGLVGLAYKF